MSLRIGYESEGFPVGRPELVGWNDLGVTWDKLLWAALTVGRPNREYVFAHGEASVYEALFRLSLIRMTLEQSGPSGRVLRRTAAAKSLDPTEKGAANYFLGMALARLFAAELLAVPWVLHLDVFGPQLGAVLTQRSRPDLIGQDVAGNWIALECKGRISPPSEEARTKAKRQAQRVERVGAQSPIHAIGAISYFRNDTLHFFWRDPDPEASVRSPIHIKAAEEDWNYCYALARGLILADEERRRVDNVLWATVRSADIEVGAHVRVWSALEGSTGVSERSWGQAARRVAMELRGELSPCNADGLIVRAGASWIRRFDVAAEKRGL